MALEMVESWIASANVGYVGNAPQQKVVSPVNSSPPKPAGPRTVCLLGLTGVGKSATANTLLGDRANASFGTSNKGDSMTSETTSKIGPWCGHGEEVRVVDTPGWLDSKGRDVDAENRRDMGKALKKLEEVHAFLLVMNAQDPRFNSAAISMLKVLASLFGKLFLRHLVVAFSRWDYDDETKEDREEEHGASEDNIRKQKASDLNTLFRDVLGHQCDDFPCIFIDNRVNFYNDKQLKRRFKDAQDEVVQELQDQFQVLFKFMSSRKPFDCHGVSVVRSERAQEVHSLVPHYLRLNPADDAVQLGRKLQTGDQDVLFSGWLWWRRRWIFGKLRRQSLRFYDNDASNSIALARPASIDLRGVICIPTGKLPFSAQDYYFTVYRPPIPTDTKTSTESYRLGVSDKTEHRKWISWIMDATQISDGCNRVQKLHDALASATSLTEYKNAVNNVEQQTIIVPVEWMQQNCPDQEAVQSNSTEDTSVKQLKKDFQREDIGFNGEEHIHTPDVEILMEKIAMSVLDETHTGDETRLRACAMALSRDALFCCSRTLGGGNALGAVESLFKNDDLVKLVGDGTPRCNICLHPAAPGDEVCPKCDSIMDKATIELKILRHKDKSAALSQVDDASGVCELLGEDGQAPSGVMGMRASRSRLEIDPEKLKAIAIDRGSWIPDVEWEHCMICGLPFSIFLRRRHHCRMCGKIVCWACSQQRLNFGEEDNTEEQRVCFVCYTKTYLHALHHNPETGLSSFPSAGDLETSWDTMSIVSAEGESTPARIEAGDNADCSFGLESVEDSDLAWPCISVTMSQIFKMCSEPDLDTLFLLHCRYFRIVRWNGTADSGRVFISIQSP